MIPAEEWWNVITNYSEFIMPFQIIWACIGFLLTIWFVIKQDKIIKTTIKGYFSFSFGFIAIVLFIINGEGQLAFISQAICFLSLTALFGFDIFLNKIQLEVPERTFDKILMFISFGLVFLYPLIGLLVGHWYPKMIIVGTFPCPTTALALVFLTGSLSNLKFRWQNLGVFASWILLIIWAVPFPLIFQIPHFGVYEDSIMLVIGLYGLVRLVIHILQTMKKSKQQPLKEVKLVNN